MEKKPQDTPSRHADKYIVRFPEGMRDKIAAAAEENGRSMNAEIIARLESSFTGGGDQSALIAAIARLNLSLANAEIDLAVSKLETGTLAKSLRHAAEALLTMADKSDMQTRNFAQGSINLADRHIGKAEEFDVLIQASVAKAIKAGEEVRNTAPKLRQTITKAVQEYIDAPDDAPMPNNEQLDLSHAEPSSPASPSEPLQGQPKNIGRKALAIGGVQSGKTLNSLAPIIEHSTPKNKKKPSK